MQDFRKLEIYKESKKIAIEIYLITSKFPNDELFGIISQLRRAAASIGANIAEGCGRGGNKDFLRFLYNSTGSLREVEHFLELSKDLGYIDESIYIEVSRSLDRLSRMLFLFIRRLKNPKPITHYPKPNR